MQKEIENYLEVGTKIKLKQKIGFLNTIGKEYVISDVDKKNKTVYFSVPFLDYSSQIFKDVSTVKNHFNGMLLCTASLSFDELLKYFTIVLEKEKEWSYIDDHGNIRHTTSKWSEWLYKNACRGKAHDGVSYRKLLMLMHSIDFDFYIRDDLSRFNDRCWS